MGVVRLYGMVWMVMKGTVMVGCDREVLPD